MKRCHRRCRTSSASLSAWHDVTKTYRRQELQTAGGPERYAQTHKKAPPVLHPLVAVHPETGRKLLYISELTTTHIEGLSETGERCPVADALPAHRLEGAALPLLLGEELDRGLG